MTTTLSQLPPQLRAVVAHELPRQAARAATIVRDLLRRDRFDRAFALRLFTIARDGRVSHELRCLASLAFEHQFRLAPREKATTLLHTIGVGEDEGSIRGRIARNEAIHQRLRRGAAGLRAFLRHTRRECRLIFARYAFTPAEVVATIRERTRATPGRHDFPLLVHNCNVDEAARAMATLPQYEREIVRLLINAKVVYWVAESTPSSLNALVEYPEGTVVLVVKPPGSDLEIEIKRAGSRGPHAIDVVHRDDTGSIVPLHHHLWGASRGDLLRFEAANSALLARIHRLALGIEAPIPRFVTMCAIDSVPAADGSTVSLLTHFSAPVRRGPLQASLERLDRPDLVTPLDFPAGRFLEATMPAQAIVVGTTSFRLDRLRAYLRDGVPFDGDADELLDEIIDDYIPPPGRFRTHKEYVAAAMAHNRVAADRTYISVLTQIGRFWGAVLGMRAGSSGESFVTRNVGLRKVWSNGRWQVRYIAMDHDAMAVAGRVHRYYNPSKNVSFFVLDQAHILGGPIGPRFLPGETGTLKAIYRVSSAVASEGLAAFRAVLRQSYAQTLQAMATDPRVRELFHEDFVDTIREWDRAVIDFCRNGRDAESRLRWRRRTRARLRRRGLPRPIVDQYVSTIVAYADVMPWFAGLYDSAGKLWPC